MYLEIKLKAQHKNDAPSHLTVCVKTGFVWFHGPNDLHIQFDGPKADNWCPHVVRGNYTAPHPETGGMMQIVSLAIRRGKPRGGYTKGYREMLEKHWESPNR